MNNIDAVTRRQGDGWTRCVLFPKKGTFCRDIHGLIVTMCCSHKLLNLAPYMKETSRFLGLYGLVMPFSCLGSRLVYFFGFFVLASKNTYSELFRSKSPYFRDLVNILSIVFNIASLSHQHPQRYQQVVLKTKTKKHYSFLRGGVPKTYTHTHTPTTTKQMRPCAISAHWT